MIAIKFTVWPHGCLLLAGVKHTRSSTKPAHQRITSSLCFSKQRMVDPVLLPVQMHHIIQQYEPPPCLPTSLLFSRNKTVEAKESLRSSVFPIGRIFCASLETPASVVVTLGLCVESVRCYQPQQKELEVPCSPSLSHRAPRRAPSQLRCIASRAAVAPHAASTSPSTQTSTSAQSSPHPPAGPPRLNLNPLIPTV